MSTYLYCLSPCVFFRSVRFASVKIASVSLSPRFVCASLFQHVDNFSTLLRHRKSLPRVQVVRSVAQLTQKTPTATGHAQYDFLCIFDYFSQYDLVTDMFN